MVIIMFEIFSFTHILLLLLIPVVIYLGYLLKNAKHYKQLLFGLSLLLFIMEVWKQYYHYYILDDWSVWIFPFQLCSIPLYIWLFYPLFDTKGFKGIETFLIDYTLLGALFALGYPEDMIKVQLVLTIHSFLWHYLLILISSLIYFSDHGDLTFKGYLHGSIFFYLCSMIATVFNVLLAKYGTISMFYINPYKISTQPVFHDIGVKLGVLPQNIIYLLAISIGALFIHIILTKIKKGSRSF